MSEQAVLYTQPIHYQEFRIADKIEFLRKLRQHPLAQRALKNQKPVHEKNELYDWRSNEIPRYRRALSATSFRRERLQYSVVCC
jgi:hypothetical protein